MDELFDTPPSQPSPLEVARHRFAEAKTVYDAANEAEDEYGDPIPSEVHRALRYAARALRIEEDAELKRRMQR